MEPVPFYRPRNPRSTPLWKLSETLYERLRGEWEDRFEARFGFWRGLADEAAHALPRLRDPGDGVCPPALRFLPARAAADLLVPDAATVPERVEMILGWRHTSGFSVHNESSCRPATARGLERLARYLARPPVSLQRMEWDREKGEVLYRTGRGHAEERGGEHERADDVERIDELEFLARVVTQLPEPRKHSIRYYGYYAAVVRAKRRRATAEAEASMPSAGNDGVGIDASEARGEDGGVHSAVTSELHSAVASEPDSTERKLLRKRWAQLIRRVYEVDPLLCACGATMRIVAIITERSVITKILTHMRKAAAATGTQGSGPGPPRHPSPGPAPDP